MYGIYKIFIFFLFQLIAGYRGYTIDSLRKLNILDDIMISADEKHHYKGLARRRGDFVNYMCRDTIIQFLI